MSQKLTGVLVMAYGSPSTINDLGSYYTHIRNGEPPTQALLDELHLRYLAIGNRSPLSQITYRQAQSLAQYLNRSGVSASFKPYVGFKHTVPFIEDAVEAMHADGIQEAAAIVMSPHVTDYGPQPYMERARRAARSVGGPRLVEVADWYREPRFTAHWAGLIRDSLARMTAEEQRATAVIFSAHSLPRSLPVTDAYAERVRESAERIAHAAGVERHALAWQSAGRRPDPWLGPDIVSVTKDLWQRLKCRTFLYCPIGFAADHLEVLYDNDIECRALVERLGGRYLRPPMPNASDSLIACLADAVTHALEQKAVPERELQS
ncbi:MAG: ferrochelatase [Burkholderiaceae bacterium]|nr:MAG: ferrochelatase [Burkholderiaceae bacterium]